VPVAKAKSLAEKALATVRELRQEKFAELTAREIAYRDFWRRIFFWLPALTSEAAEIKLAAKLFPTIEWYYWRHEEAANNVLRLCKVAPPMGDVTLDSETLKLIYGQRTKAAR
jgi:hypothetical protein